MKEGGKKKREEGADISKGIPWNFATISQWYQEISET